MCLGLHGGHLDGFSFIHIGCWVYYSCSLHIDWPLSQSSCMTRTLEEGGIMQMREMTSGPSSKAIYCLPCEEEILFAARDEKAISFRWSPLITHPVCVYGCRRVLETGLHLEDQCFSIERWRQSNNNTSLPIAISLFYIHSVPRSQSLCGNPERIAYTQTLICLIYIDVSPVVWAICCCWTQQKTALPFFIPRIMQLSEPMLLNSFDSFPMVGCI